MGTYVHTCPELQNRLINQNKFYKPVFVVPVIAALALENLSKLCCGLCGVAERRSLVLAAVPDPSPAVEQYPQVLPFLIHHLQSTPQEPLCNKKQVQNTTDEQT